MHVFVWQEITRDESRAGSVDALLAQLEFALTEATAAGADLTSLLGSMGSASVLPSTENPPRETSHEVGILVSSCRCLLCMYVCMYMNKRYVCMCMC